MLYSGNYLSRIGPDASFGYIFSKDENRVIFGKGSVHFYKIKSDITINVAPDYEILDLKANSVEFQSVSDTELAIIQKIYMNVNGSLFRRITITNMSARPLLVRLLFYCDPCFVHLKQNNLDSSFAVDAFNRGSYVFLEEIPSRNVRLIGCLTHPSKIFMTKDKHVLDDVLKKGRIPSQTYGLSSYPIVIIENELELKGLSSQEVTYSISYSTNGIEDALEKYRSLNQNSKSEKLPMFFSSEKDLEIALNYAFSQLNSVPPVNQLDELESLYTRLLLFQEEAEKDLAKLVSQAEKGFIGHTLDNRLPGILETSMLLYVLSSYLSGKDKKKIKKYTSKMKKIAGFLAKNSDKLDELSRSFPTGWRRASRNNLLVGLTPELILSVCSAFDSYSKFCMIIGKPEDATKYHELSASIVKNLNILADQHGRIPLFFSGKETVWDDTIDQAVACYRYTPSIKIAAYYFQRLNSEDFETGYGPRTVPSSNKRYFHCSEAYGQLGGYWTRAALAHCILGYKIGASKLASMELLKISKLIASDTVSMGGAYGSAPFWIDTCKRKVHGEFPDIVAASRLVEAVLFHEIGIKEDKVEPALNSSIEWIFLGLPALDSYYFVCRDNGKCILLSNKSSSFSNEIYQSFNFESINNNFLIGSFYGRSQVTFIANRERRSFSREMEIPVRIPSKEVIVHIYVPDEPSWKRIETSQNTSRVKLNLDSIGRSWHLLMISPRDAK